jgi:hypothetical protein
MITTGSNRITARRSPLTAGIAASSARCSRICGWWLKHSSLAAAAGYMAPRRFRLPQAESGSAEQPVLARQNKDRLPDPDDADRRNCTLTQQAVMPRFVISWRAILAAGADGFEGNVLMLAWPEAQVAAVQPVIDPGAIGLIWYSRVGA